MRFQLGIPQQRSRTNRWSVVFEAYVGQPGDEQIYARQVGVLEFGTEDAALAAGLQAFKILEETGRLPRIF